MANPTRTIRVRFDGDAKGLTRAVAAGLRDIKKFNDDVRKSGKGGIMSGIVDSIRSGAGQVKEALSSVFQGGLKGTLSTPIVGPIIIAALAAIATTIAPAVGTLIGGLLITGLGAAITGAGAFALFHVEEVNKEWSKAEQKRVEESNKQAEKLRKQWREVGRDVIGALRDAAQPLIPVFDTARQVIRGLAKEFGPVLKSSFQIAKSPLQTFVKQLGEAFKRLAPAIEPLMKSFGDLLTTIGPYIIATFQLISDELITMAGRMSQNKDAFGLLMAFILATIPTVLRIINWLISAFQSIVNGAKSVQKTVSTAFNAIKPVVSSVMNAIRTTIASVLKIIHALFNGNLNDVKKAIRDGLSAIKSAWSSAWNSIKSLFLAIWPTIKNALSSATSSLWNGIRNLGSRIISFMRSVPGKILNALGNMGGLLYQAGANVINGLINGISSRINAVRAKIASVTQTIRNHLPFSPAKEGPLSGSGNPENSGRKIGQMLADGIGSQKKTVRFAMSDLLSGGLQPASASATVSPNYEVKVFIGERELQQIVRSEVSEVNRGIRRRALAA